ncbi:GNAT family N-acetyltransferase [Streptomyces sp. NBRC 109706]|uniref:GNAT family N-acetyltransferase n=1 Tax=Streptomyces sp. NBRC 109706 TaxID=1550035 RepID=UPI0007814AB0|nr:GNAT family N-acetyltransferase [Streptomyces sp. NBRC 109706]
MTSADDLPIRRLALADLSACLDLSDDRSWGREEHKWRLLLSAGQGYGIDAPPDDPVGGLVATVIRTSYGDQWHAVGMMLVASRWERRGIGLRLMRHLIAGAEGVPLLLTATDNGRPMYERLGFKALGGITTLTGTFAGDAGDPEAGAGVRPATAADMPEILAYDLPAFGADRTELLTRLASFANRILVARAPDGRLTGFGATWPNVTTTSVGPVLADDPAVARALIARLATGTATPARLDVADEHPELLSWAREHGLAPAGRTTLMVLGAPEAPGDPTRRFAPYSMAHG